MGKKPSIAIVGAGLTGLSAAYFLEREGGSATVFEASDRVGGAITTRRSGDYLYELGPSTLLRGSSVLEEILRDLSLESSLAMPGPEARCRYVVRKGKPVALPSSPFSFPFSPWLSARGKLRLLTEPFRRRGKHRETESVAEFTRRRLGPEVLDYGVSPVVGGIYAGDPRNLSLRLAFPRLYLAEEKGGSLMRGFWRLMREQKKARGDAPRPPRGTISFRDGLDTLPKALASSLQSSLRLGTRMEKLQKDASGGWRISWVSSDGKERGEEVFDRVLLTSWTPELAGAVPPPPGRPDWPEVTYAPVQVVTLAFPQQAGQHPLDGFGVLVPEKEKLPFLGVIFASSLFAGRAPGNQVLVNLFLGGQRSPEAAAYGEEDLRAKVFPALDQLLGLRGEPLFMDRRAWPRAIPQYTNEHATFLEARKQWEAENAGLHLAGTAVDGISMPQCLESGRRIVREKLSKA